MYLAGLWLGVETLPFEIHIWSLLFPRSCLAASESPLKTPSLRRPIQPPRRAVATHEGYHRSNTVALLLSHNQMVLGNAKLVPCRLRLSVLPHTPQSMMMTSLSNEADEGWEVEI